MFLESFKLLSIYALPANNSRIHVYVPTLKRQDAMCLVPDGNVIRVFNISHFTPKSVPTFPLNMEGGGQEERQGEPDGIVDARDGLAETITQGLHLIDPTTREQGQDQDQDQDQEPVRLYPREKPTRKLFDELRSWTVSAERAQVVHEKLPDVDQCEMVWDGKAIVGISNKGAFFQWHLKGT